MTDPWDALRHSLVRYVASKYTSLGSGTEDLVQEALYQMIRYQRKPVFDGWLLRTVDRLFAYQYRKKLRSPRIVCALESTDSADERTTESEVHYKQLLYGFSDKLDPDRRRILFDLIHGFEPEEISVSTGIPHREVIRKTHEIRKSYRQYLEQLEVLVPSSVIDW